MPSAPTPYVFACNAPVLFARGQTNTSALPVYYNGLAVLPTGGTYVLKDIAGTTVSAPSVSFGTDNIAYVSVPNTDLPDTLRLGEGYSEHWTLTLEGVARPFRRDAVVSLFELHPPMPETDIVEGEYPTLLQDISGYSDTLQPYMDAAWRELVRTLVKRGDFPDIVVEPGDVYEWFRQMVLERIFRMLYKAQETQRFKDLWEYHEGKARQEKDGCRFKVDRARRGLADSLAREPSSRSVHVNLPPKRRTYRNEW